MKNYPFIWAGGSLPLAACLVLTSCATTPPAPTSSSTTSVQEGVPGGVFVKTTDMSARVTAIDRSTRTATLVDSSGKKFPVTVGPGAVNFDQIKVGDLVKAQVTEELAVALADESPQRDSSAGLVALAPRGAQPGGVVAGSTRLNATVVGIDPANRNATLRFDDGGVKTLPVRGDVDLGRLRVGQRVVFNVNRMVALKVEKP